MAKAAKGARKKAPASPKAKRKAAMAATSTLTTGEATVAALLANGMNTRTVPVDLEPYRTHTVDFQFYFPRAGKFTHYPSHVSKSERVVAVAPTARLGAHATALMPSLVSVIVTFVSGTLPVLVTLKP